MVITYPTWNIIIPKLSIRSEKVDIEMQLSDRHANEQWTLKRLEGDFTGRKKGDAAHWTVSQKFIVIDITKANLK